MSAGLIEKEAFPFFDITSLPPDLSDFLYVVKDNLDYGEKSIPENDDLDFLHISFSSPYLMGYVIDSGTMTTHPIIIDVIKKETSCSLCTCEFNEKKLFPEIFDESQGADKPTKEGVSSEDISTPRESTPPLAFQIPKQKRRFSRQDVPLKARPCIHTEQFMQHLCDNLHLICCIDYHFLTFPQVISPLFSEKLRKNIALKQRKRAAKLEELMVKQEKEEERELEEQVKETIQKTICVDGEIIIKKEKEEEEEDEERKERRKEEKKEVVLKNVSGGKCEGKCDGTDDTDGTGGTDDIQLSISKLHGSRRISRTAAGGKESRKDEEEEEQISS
ncbi:hypothetical protein ADUPG1_006135, partial [Aduncisulcus paluster]